MRRFRLQEDMSSPDRPTPGLASADENRTYLSSVRSYECLELHQRAAMSLIIDSVSKRFGEVQALDDISLQIDPGEVFGFLGANGAGKTTAMRIVLDILRPDSGTIVWNGMSNTQVSARDLGLPSRGARSVREDDGARPARLLRQAPRREAEGCGARDSRVARTLPHPGIRRPSRRAAVQGQSAEDPVHRRDPPRPAGAADGRAVHGPGPGQRGPAQAGVPGDEGPWQDADLLDAPDGDGRGAVRVDRHPGSGPGGRRRIRARSPAIDRPADGSSRRPGRSRRWPGSGHWTECV